MSGCGQAIGTDRGRGRSVGWGAVRSWAASVAACLALLLVGGLQAQPIEVCVSSTDVKTLVQAVGGDAVNVTGFVKGPDDPHSVEATPAMVKALARAELLVVVGMGLEEAWLPAMLKTAGNAKLAEGGPGHLSLEGSLRTITGPQGRGVPGSFHPEDNPHFLLDPVEGVKAAKLIADRLATLRPQQATAFAERYQLLARGVMNALLGEAMAAGHKPEDLENLCIAIERGELESHLAKHGGAHAPLGGWLQALAPYRDTSVVGDHDLWPYFARRYGVRVLGYMEPEPGVPPTIPHLTDLVKRMKQERCRVILSVQYFDARHAAFLAERAGAVVAPMANQPGGRPGTDSYLDFVNYNARALLDALKAAKP